MEERDPQAGSPSQREAPDAMALTLRRAREARGLTTREVATRIGVSPGFITLIETGRKRPGAETARALAGALGLPEEPLLAWVELGGRYERKSRATEVIAHYLRRQEGQKAPEQAMPRSRALLMMSRLLGGTQDRVASASDVRFQRAAGRGTPADQTTGLPRSFDALMAEDLAAEELLAEFSSEQVRGLLRIPILAEGADPTPPGSPSLHAIDRVMIDRALLPTGIPVEDGWAYRLSAAGGRNVPDSLTAGDVVVLTRRAWPVASGEAYAVLLHGRIELARVAAKGDSLVVLLAEGVEFLRLPAPDAPPPELRGRVVLVVRGSKGVST